MRETVLYVDTNSFIQLRDLKDVAWRGLLPGVERVILMVARAVVDELDEHKTSTNQRRRDRARAALRLIAAASEAPDRTLRLREAPIEIDLTIAPRRKVDYEALELDRSSPDDRLVGAAKLRDGAAVLSHDSGPRIAARDLGMKAYAPPDDWLLAPERSDDQRKLAEAERRIKTLQDARPAISITFPDADEAGVVVLRRLRLVPLPDAVAIRLAGLIEEQHPPMDLPEAGTGTIGRMRLAAGAAYSDDEVSRYGQQRAAWRAALLEWAKGLHDAVAARTNARPLYFDVANTGGASAERLVVRLQAEAGLFMLADAAAKMSDRLVPPKPRRGRQGRPPI